MAVARLRPGQRAVPARLDLRRAGPDGAPPRRVVAHAGARRDHPRPARLGHQERRRRRRRASGGRGSDRADAVRDAAQVQEGRRPRAAARAARRADVGPLRDAAARHRADAAARPRRLRHRLAQRARRAALGGPLRPRRVHRAPDRVHGRPRPGRQRRRDLPALRRRARRGRDHGRGRSPGAAGEPDADGRADRLPHRPDGGQQAGDEQADRLVREEPDRPRALAPARARAGASTPASSS